MDDIWVVVWLVVFAGITGLAGYLLYANRSKKLGNAKGAPPKSEHTRPHGHHRQGH
ncbi:MAG: hypothetical protein K1X94_29805 [Sandaracinaceae bacterium]|nr:hypothetical protein [Sandaracinaceae bacterium]